MPQKLQIQITQVKEDSIAIMTTDSSNELVLWLKWEEIFYGC